MIKQRDQDNALCLLLGTIKDVHSLVIEAEPLKVYESHQAALDTLARQTVECAYFVRDYAADGLGEP